MNRRKNKDIHTLSILVANKPGVLIRCAQVFARRGFNIDALVVSPGVNPKYSRMTITVQGEAEALDQIIKQTSKLVDVIHCMEHARMDALTREFMLIKVKHTPQTESGLKDLLKKEKAKIIEDQEGVFIVESAGASDELDDLETRLKKYGIVEMVRSGKLVMASGRDAT